MGEKVLGIYIIYIYILLLLHVPVYTVHVLCTGNLPLYIETMVMPLQDVGSNAQCWVCREL